MNDSSYSRLQLEPIRGTLGRLERRVGERFPHSGLHGVAREMVRLGDAIEAEIAERPRWWLRTLSVVGVLGVVGVAAWAIRNSVRIAALGVGDIADLLQGLDAASNLLVVLALTLVFLISLEGRLKRRPALPRLRLPAGSERGGRDTGGIPATPPGGLPATRPPSRMRASPSPLRIT